MDEVEDLRAVVFDLDGLITNTEELYDLAGNAVMRRRGREYEGPIREQMMGRPAREAYQYMIDYYSLPDTYEDLKLECQLELDRLLATSLAAMPGLYELLDELRGAELPIAVATSSERMYAEHILERLEIKSRFRFVLTAEDIRHGKPNPEIYLLAASRLQLAPQQIMVLEDSAHGCQAGVDAGAYTVAVPHQFTRNHPYPGARLVADTLADPRIRQVLGLGV